MTGIGEIPGRGVIGSAGAAVPLWYFVPWQTVPEVNVERITLFEVREQRQEVARNAFVSRVALGSV